MLMSKQSGFASVWILVLGALAIIVVGGFRVASNSSTPDLSKINFVHPSKSLVAVGDIECGPAQKVFNDGLQCQSGKTAELTKKLDPNFVLALGDLQYDNGAGSSFDSLYDKDWGQFKSITYPSPGNHEYYTAGASGYFDYFNKDNPLATIVSKPYYSFDRFNWHFVALNSNCDDVGGCGGGSAQLKWLESDLQASTATCTLAFWHHPRFTSGRYANKPASNNRSIDFWKQLQTSKADIVLNGHDHIYERFLPQTSAGQEDDIGIQEFIVGTGGKELYSITSKAKNSAFRDDKHFGVLQLELFGKAYKWSFIDIHGKVVDSGYRKCQA